MWEVDSAGDEDVVDLAEVAYADGWRLVSAAPPWVLRCPEHADRSGGDVGSELTS